MKHAHKLALWLAAAIAVSSAAAPRPAAAQGKPAAAPHKLTRPPRLVKFKEAPFPEEEKARGKGASVVMQIAISAEGKVDQVAIVESAGAAFDAAAMAAAQQFVFEPAEIDDRPAAVKIVYRYEFALKVEKPTTAFFKGTVRARGKGPLAGVRVELDSGQSAVTDAEGRFSFKDISPGKHTITLSGERLAGLMTEEQLEAGKQLDATYEVEPKDERGGKRGDGANDEDSDDLEIVVKAPPLTKQVVSTEVSAEQGRRVPGTSGDVLKVVESLPGVGRPAAGSGSLVVWGAAPQDTRVYVDGVRVPLLYHNGGVRSIVHSDLVGGVELAPGGYGPAYGRGLGGLVTVKLRRLEGEGVHGSAAVDLYDASAVVRASIGERLRFAVAARRSHLDQVLSRVTSRDINDVTPVPRYADAQARVAYDLAQGEVLESGLLWSRDDIDRTLASADPAEKKSETRSVSFWRVYGRYHKETASGADITVVPSFGVDSSTLQSRFGQTPTALDIDARVYGLRATWRGRLAEHVTATVGLDGEVTSANLHRAGSVTSPPREGDVRVFGQPPSDQINVDDWGVVIASAAPFGEVDLALLEDRLHILPGVRLDPYFVSGTRRTPLVGDTPSVGFSSQEAVIEPRLSARLAASEAITLKAGFGKYHQAPLPEDLSAVFGSPQLGLSSASHYLAGASARFSELWSFETTGFYARSEALPIRSPASSPLLAQALVGEGQGRAFGTQFMLRRDLGGGFFGWVSYTLLRSERTDRPDGGYRPFDYDQTHVFTALGSYDLGAGFEVGARLRYATGLPRTPVVRSYFDARRDQFTPVFGPHNSERIAAFYQLDVRASKRWKAGPLGLECFLDVQNVTNHPNAEEIVYSRDYRQKSFITGLPLLPIVGAKASW
jgi:TonB family protein